MSFEEHRALRADQVVDDGRERAASAGPSGCGGGKADQGGSGGENEGLDGDHFDLCVYEEGWPGNVCKGGVGSFGLRAMKV